MLFLSPLVLWSLLPWAGVTLYLLRGRRPQLPVPFLELWRTTQISQRRESRFPRLPPLGLAAMLLASLLALVAAARPALRRPGGTAVVILDRGIRMSAIPRGKSSPRFVTLADLAANRLRDASVSAIDLVDVLTGQTQRTSVSDLPAAVRGLPRTAVDTVSMLGPAVRNELERRPADSVFVLTDSEVDVTDARLTVLRPTESLHNVGIATIAARAQPAAQVMVEIGNQSALAAVDLEVSSGGGSARRKVALGSTGRTRVFIDLPSLGDSVEARLVDVADDLDADNVAYLARESAPPRLEARSPLPEAMQRMLKVFTGQRPPVEASVVVAVTTRRGDVGAEPAAIIEMPPAADASVERPVVATHPVTALVDWPGILKSAALAPAAPEGFTPLVKVGAHTAVAVRTEPARQVWVGFDASEFPRLPDFVVFWTNVFTWLSGNDGGGAFATHPVTVVPPSWTPTLPDPPGVDSLAWPNVFKQVGGGLYASTAVAGAAARSTPQPRSKASRAIIPTMLDLGPYLLVAALACALVVAATWPGKAPAAAPSGSVTTPSSPAPAAIRSSSTTPARA